MHSWYLLLALLVDARALRFLAVGDWGCDCPNQYHVAKWMGTVGAQLNIDFVTGVGDHFYDTRYGGCPNNAQSVRFEQTFDKVYTAPSLQTRWYNILGNHDWGRNHSAYFGRTALSPRWYQPDYYFTETIESKQGAGSVQLIWIDTHAIVLVSTGSHSHESRTAKKVVERQQKWVQEVISQSKADWVLVVGHHPVYSGGHYPGGAGVAEALVPLFKTHGVAAYFDGHDHNMQHLSHQNVEYFVNGNGGLNVDSRRHQLSPPNGSQRFYSAGGGFTAVQLESKASMKVEYYGSQGQRVYCYRVFNPRTTSGSNIRSDICEYKDKLAQHVPPQALELGEWLLRNAVNWDQIKSIVKAGTTTIQQFVALDWQKEFSRHGFRKRHRDFVTRLIEWTREEIAAGRPPWRAQKPSTSSGGPGALQSRASPPSAAQNRSAGPNAEAPRNARPAAQNHSTTPAAQSSSSSDAPPRRSPTAGHRRHSRRAPQNRSETPQPPTKPQVADPEAHARPGTLLQSAGVAGPDHRALLAVKAPAKPGGSSSAVGNASKVADPKSTKDPNINTVKSTPNHRRSPDPRLKSESHKAAASPEHITAAVRMEQTDETEAKMHIADSLSSFLSATGSSKMASGTAKFWAFFPVVIVVALLVTAIVRMSRR
uniref:Calcineurin-like phosphoesterase domain-containing protein n=1 Tax=Eutreptiella gymnastica TaxID=73025 RepID=A0A7S4G6S8_9EUGL